MDRLESEADRAIAVMLCCFEEQLSSEVDDDDNNDRRRPSKDQETEQLCCYVEQLSLQVDMEYDMNKSISIISINEELTLTTTTVEQQFSNTM